jgi:TonB family protein
MVVVPIELVVLPLKFFSFLPINQLRSETVIAKNTLRIIIFLFTFVWSIGAQDQPKRVSHADALAAALTKVTPEYPMMARQLKISGSVELEANVAEDGTVESVHIVSGNPVLTKPAADAVKKWKFKPFTSDGKPVKAVAQIALAFK